MAGLDRADRGARVMMAASSILSAPAPRIASPRLALIAFVAVVTLARLWAAAIIHLTEDEAYYRLWAASLQFGYYDHPPMIAWWIRAGMMVAGDTPLGVRLIPVLSCGLGSLIVFDLTQRLGCAARTAERATVWYNATLIVGLGGFLATPDAPAVLFWTLTLWCLVRASERGAARWWIAAGVAGGLAAISKYSALFLAPGVLIWLSFRPERAKILKTPWPWLAAAIAGAFFATNLVWNAEHHWVSFVKQFGRVAPRGLAPSHVVELILVEFVLLNPIVSLFAARGVAEAARGAHPGFQPGPGAPDLSLPLASSIPFAAYLLIHSFHDRVEAHWPAPLYPALAILAASAAAHVAPGGVWAGLRRAAAPLGLILSVLVMLHLLIPATDLTGVADPSLAIRDWPGFAQRVDAARRANAAGWVGTISYGTAAQLAFDPPRAAPVVELMERDRFPANDPSWRADLAQPGLVVDIGRRAGDMRALRGCFASVQPLADLDRGATPYAVYRVARPRRDVLGQGCWPSKDALHAESQRYAALDLKASPIPVVHPR